MKQWFKPIFYSACTAVLVASLTPTPYLPELAFDWWDKAQHFVAFLVLMLLGGLAYQRTLLPVAVGLVLFGAFIEVAQAATGWRYGELADWLADMLGVLLGWILISLLLRRTRPI